MSGGLVGFVFSPSISLYILILGCMSATIVLLVILKDTFYGLRRLPFKFEILSIAESSLLPPQVVQ